MPFCTWDRQSVSADVLKLQSPQEYPTFPATNQTLRHDLSETCQTKRGASLFFSIVMMYTGKKSLLVPTFTQPMPDPMVRFSLPLVSVNTLFITKWHEVRFVWCFLQQTFIWCILPQHFTCSWIMHISRMQFFFTPVCCHQLCRF